MERPVTTTLSQDDLFVKHLFENLQGEGKTFFQSLINCNEHLDILTQLVPILVKDVTSYRKGCLPPLIAEKTLEVCSKFDKKRLLVQLKQNLREVNDLADKERARYEKGIEFKRKEADFKRNCEQNQIFYEDKTSEYYKQIKMLENFLVEVGFNEDLREESINGIVEDNNRVRDQIKEINDKLVVYNFQPDEESLKKAIDDLKQQIESMSDDFDKVIEGM